MRTPSDLGDILGIELPREPALTDLLEPRDAVRVGEHQGGKRELGAHLGARRRFIGQFISEQVAEKDAEGGMRHAGHVDDTAIGALAHARGEHRAEVAAARAEDGFGRAERPAAVELEDCLALDAAAVEQRAQILAGGRYASSKCTGG